MDVLDVTSNCVVSHAWPLRLAWFQTHSMASAAEILALGRSSAMVGCVAPVDPSAARRVASR